VIKLPLLYLVAGGCLGVIFGSEMKKSKYKSASFSGFNFTFQQ